MIAFTTYYFLNKVYKSVSGFWKIIFSVMFALSGYTLINYTNIFWLDNVILFPILLLGIKKIIEEKKIWLYVLTLFFNLIICYQITYAVLFAVLACSAIIVFAYLPKRERKKFVLLLGIGTILAIMLSAFLLFPALVQSLTSYRLSGEVKSSVENTNFLEKLSFLLISPIAIFFFFKLQKHIKEDRKNILCINLIMLITGIIPIFIERTNLFWHAGSYLGFPFRFAFIPIFTLINGAMYYVFRYNTKENNSEEVQINLTKKIRKRTILACIIYILIYLIIFTLLTLLIENINHEMPSMSITNKGFCLLLISSILFIIETFISIKIEEPIIGKMLLLLNVIFSVFIFSVCYIGVRPEYRKGKEWSDEALKISNDLMSKIEVNENNLYRFKDPERLLNENYPLIINQPSLSSWLHLISKEQIDTHSKLGYSKNITKLSDAGGTIFSDAILNVKYLFSKTELSSDIYDCIGETEDNTKIYEYKNIFPIGIIYNTKEKKEDLSKENVFEVQNDLYKKLMEKDDNILNIIEKDKYKTSVEERKISYKFKIEEKSYLYCYMNQNDINRISIYINGKILNIPDINNYENTIYPATSNNGILNLGEYENETVNIKILMKKGTNVNDITFSTLEFSKYEEMFNVLNNQNIDIEIKNKKIKIIIKNEEKDKSVFLPINYDKGWSVKINGEEENIDRVFGNYIGLDLKEGDNVIELIFLPRGMLIGIIITLGAVIFIGIYTLCSKQIISSKIINNLVYIFYFIIIIGFYSIVYITNILRTLVDVF